MKLKKSQLKEIIRQSIKEITYKDHLAKQGKKLKMVGGELKVVPIEPVEPKVEGGPGSGRPKERGSDDDYAPDGGHFNAAQAAEDEEEAAKKKKPKSKKDNKKALNKEKEYLKDLQQSLKDPETPKAFADMYRDNIKRSKARIKKLQGESVKVREGKLTEGRKCTVKEVKKWMKGLEENRYKKTYNSDARRVSWLVNNNLSEDYDTMPVSMKKKWPKAQYGRERHLANEYIKHLQSKQISEMKLQLGELKLRRTIREIIKEVKNGTKKTR